MKKTLLTLSAGLLVAGAAQAATIVYQDDFDSDTLATNVGIPATNTGGVGGGLVSRSIQGGVGYNFSDDGNLQYNTSSTNFQNRAMVYTSNGFQSNGGFQLTVDYLWTSSGGASRLGFGLVSNDTTFSTYNGFSPYAADTSVYSFGVDTEVGLAFTNGSTVDPLDAGSLGTSTSAKTVIMSVAADGLGGADWAWSLDGVDQDSGNIAAFDFTKTFHFVGYGQDDQGQKNIQFVSLSAIPEPSSTALLGLGFAGLLLRRKRNS